MTEIIASHQNYRFDDRWNPPASCHFYATCVDAIGKQNIYIVRIHHIDTEILKVFYHKCLNKSDSNPSNQSQSRDVEEKIDALLVSAFQKI